MDDAAASSAPEATPFDPRTSDPRELLQVLLPQARTSYVKAWELLADPATQLDRRRTARTGATELSQDLAAVAEVLRVRESSLSGDGLLNARHLAGELERLVDALARIGALPVLGIAQAKDLRPDALGCGKRFRNPTIGESAATTTRGVSNQPASKPRGDRDRDRNRDKPFNDRGPKVDRGALGTSKHDSQLADDLDPDTRAKLEAMRAALESGE